MKIALASPLYPKSIDDAIAQLQKLVEDAALTECINHLLP